MRSKAQLILAMWLFVIILFILAIGTVVLQVQYHIKPTPWVIVASCILGGINVLLFPVFLWLDWKEGQYVSLHRRISAK